MVEIIIIVAVALAVIILIPVMIRRDFKSRLINALRQELDLNIKRLQEYSAGLSGAMGAEDGTALSEQPCILEDNVFRKLRKVQFTSAHIRQQDMDLLEEALAAFEQAMKLLKTGDNAKLKEECIHTLMILDSILGRLPQL